MRLTSERKLDHVRINLEEDVGFKGLTTGLERYCFLHSALPELNLQEVDTHTTLFKKTLAAPLVISSMTGGAGSLEKINANLATAAQQAHIAMGVGSQRAAIVDPRSQYTFRVRDYAPDILLFANLGAVQLNYGFGVTECQRAVEMIAADCLILHLNPLQECVQPEGDTNWSNLLPKIEEICHKVGVPVIAKEVGWGLSFDVCHRLWEIGISGLDVAGSGGTSWSEVEAHRTTDERLRRLALTFREWGIPTADTLLMARQAAPELTLIASGGLRNGLEVAKAIALGAHAAAMAGPFLRHAVNSVEAVVEEIETLRQELRLAMFLSANPDLAHLRDTPALISIKVDHTDIFGEGC
ncbi:MAG: type 2 isopentenyl-diphosphate Delta-isomerase [Chloroflexi bacterium]|nr:type 2 isopentenyl-diphosphate Delta-isomerase [Chloroflexota bacterium]